jgi:DNA repair photolyase
MSAWHEDFEVRVVVTMTAGQGNKRKTHRLEFGWPSLDSRADVAEALAEAGAAIKSLPKGNGTPLAS